MCDLTTICAKTAFQDNIIGGNVLVSHTGESLNYANECDIAPMQIYLKNLREGLKD